MGHQQGREKVHTYSETEFVKLEECSLNVIISSLSYYQHVLEISLKSFQIILLKDEQTHRTHRHTNASKNRTALANVIMNRKISEKRIGPMHKYTQLNKYRQQCSCFQLENVKL